MLRYQCLVLDHDDTVVASEEAINYPCFLDNMRHFRPGEFLTRDEFTYWCFKLGFEGLMRERYQFTDEEMKEEFQMWLDYSKTRIPPAYPGISDIIAEQLRRGGIVCVSSHSGKNNILRDYQTHFGIEPNEIFSWDMAPETRKPSPYALEHIMDKYGLTERQIVMIDDLKPGFDMAKKVNVDFIFAGWGRKNVPEINQFMEQHCDFAFYDTQKLYEFLFP